MTRFALQLLGLLICAVLVNSRNVETKAVIPESRIISGNEAVLGQLPWQVIIKTDEFDYLTCGGSIISNSWVLTAAHCCDGHDSLILRFGTIDLFDDSALNMTATNIYIHPQYDPKTYNNDVCLINLPAALQYSSTIWPINLVPTAQASSNFVGSIAVIAGFGLTSDDYNEPSDNLLWAQVQIIENSDCSPVYKEGLVIDSTICGKGYGVANMSICNGDSGGPLVTKDSNGYWIQIGINSFVPVDQCAESLPSAYARITSFLQYIYNTTGLAPV